MKRKWAIAYTGTTGAIVVNYHQWWDSLEAAQHVLAQELEEREHNNQNMELFIIEGLFP